MRASGNNPVGDIVDEKERLSDAMQEAGEAFLASAYGALARGEDTVKAIKETKLKHLARNLNDLQAQALKREAMALSATAKRKLPKATPEGLALLPLLAYKAMFKRLHAAEHMRKRVITPLANEYEAEAKKSLLEEFLGDSKENTQGEAQNAPTGTLDPLKGIPEDNPPSENDATYNHRGAEGVRYEYTPRGEPLPDGNAPIFVLVSAHADSAEDHRDFQGRLYYDRFWRRKVSDPSTRKKVNIFISSEGLKSFQWVIGAPVWMITRPNCRHYFKAISIQDAFEAHGDCDALLDANGMREHGRQNFYHSTRKGWYTRENVQAIIKKYEERVRMLKRICKEAPNEMAENDLSKAKLLLRKWKRFYASHIR